MGRATAAETEQNAAEVQLLDRSKSQLLQLIDSGPSKKMKNEASL